MYNPIKAYFDTVDELIKFVTPLLKKGSTSIREKVTNIHFSKNKKPSQIGNEKVNFDNFVSVNDLGKKPTRFPYPLWMKDTDGLDPSYENYDLFVEGVLQYISNEIKTNTANKSLAEIKCTNIRIDYGYVVAYLKGQKIPIPKFSIQKRKESYDYSYAEKRFLESLCVNLNSRLSEKGWFVFRMFEHIVLSPEPSYNPKRNK